MALREVLQNGSLGLVPAGFLDDDPRKHKQRVDGYRVLGPLAALPEVLDATPARIAVVIVTIRNLNAEAFGEICACCDARGVPRIEVRRMRFSLEDAYWRDRTPGIVRFPSR